MITVMSKIAYIFPGQGSQAVGMGQNLCAHSEAARTIFEQADEYLGEKISTLCFYGPEDALKQTIHTQPALYVTSAAVLAALRERGVPAPEAVAGHSVGEYAALYAAGAFDFETGLKLGQPTRSGDAPGGLVSAGGNGGGSGADGASRSTAVCAEAQSAGTVSAANFNGGGQVVISGSPEGVAKASELAKAAGAKRVLPLNVSGAFHSALMAPAVEAMEYALRDAVIQSASIPVVANLTADYETTPDEIRANLAAQIDHPVRWEETILRLVGDGFDTFVEVGSGTVLAGLMKRIAPDVKAIGIGDMAAVEAFAA